LNLFKLKLWSTEGYDRIRLVGYYEHEEYSYAQKSIKFIQHKVLMRMNLSQVLMNRLFVHRSVKTSYTTALFMIREFYQIRKNSFYLNPELTDSISKEQI